MDPVVDCVGLDKAMGGRQILRGLTFSVAAGEVFGLLGPNGAGKTTTMRILLGLSRPTAGVVSVLGLKPGSAALAGRVGALIEEPACYPWMTGRQHLQTVSDAGVPASDRQIGQVLQRVRLDGAAQKKIKTYSQGMRQRLGIATAILRRPELVVLDEPTNGLDPVGIVEFRGLIAGLVDQGSTVLVSSHLLSEIEQVCTSLAVLINGEVVRWGPIEQVTAGSDSVQVTVRAQDLRRAHEVLAARYPTSIDSPTSLSVSGVDSRSVGEILYGAGLIPEQVTARRSSLESLFLTLAGGATADAPAPR